MNRLAWLLLGCSLLAAASSGARNVLRPPTVADAIELTLAREPISDQPQSVFSSADGNRFAVLVNRGDLKRNVRVYSLMLYETAACIKGCAGTVLLQSETADNNPAIASVVWSKDGNSLIYLGRDSNALAQVFKVATEGSRLVALSHSATGVIDFAVSENGEFIVYAERSTDRALFSNASERARGVAVTGETLWSLIAERASIIPPNIDSPQASRLVVLGRDTEREFPLPAGAELFFDEMTVSSDGGRVVLLRRESSRDIPGGDQLRNVGTDGNVLTHWEADIETGSFRRLIDAYKSSKKVKSESGNEWVASVEESPASSPRLVLSNRKTGRKRMIWSLNPQLAQIELGSVSEFHVTLDGVDSPLACGLYLPVGYVTGKRYPLVIQTHGWDNHSFQMDGYATAGYAAQALAGRGFVVAQLPMPSEFSSVKEGPVNAHFFDAVIDELDGRGLVDVSRVGIQGWSRTGYSARYALQNARHEFGAAVLVDSMAAGYLDYLGAEHPDPGYQATLEQINGGPPWGEGLRAWVASAPPFNNHKTRGAVLLIPLGPMGLIDTWEDFVTLRHLRKPVELQYFPDARHWPVKPAERLSIQEAVVDWFDFWLRGHRDETLAKAGQYRRWESLRTR